MYIYIYIYLNIEYWLLEAAVNTVYLLGGHKSLHNIYMYTHSYAFWEHYSV